MKPIVDVLCLATSLACAFLLLRSFRRNGVRLLMWAGLCFALFALGNVVLLIDEFVYADSDLSTWRKIPMVLGVLLLVHGLVAEGE